MKKYISSFFKLIIDFFVIATIFLILISIYTVFQTTVMKKNYSNVFGYTVFEVKTGSMSGSIEIGDVVVVKVLNENEKNMLNIGDIISFYDEKNIITHRIKEIDKEIVTKGDANNAADDPINKDVVIGKVLKTIPKVGIYKKVLLDKKVFLLICLTISLFILSFSIDEKDKIKDEAKNIKNKTKNKDNKIKDDEKNENYKEIKNKKKEGNDNDKLKEK